MNQRDPTQQATKADSAPRQDIGTDARRAACCLRSRRIGRTVVFLLLGGIYLLPAGAVDLEPLEQQRLATGARPMTAAQTSPATSRKATPLEQQQRVKTPPRAQTTTGRQTAPAQPAPGKTENSGEMLFNFQDADMKAVIKTISQLTGINFVLDPRVKGKVSIISAKPVSKQAAYDIFLTAIKAQGFTAAPVRPGVMKIIPVGEGKQNASIRRRDFKRGGEQMVTHVVVMQHGTATEMVPLLRPLMAPTSQLSAYAAANALIITDYADNVQRLMTVIGEIDQPVSTDVTIVPLQHASALDMAELVSQLTVQGPRGRAVKGGAVAAAGSRTSIVPDLRTNSLLIRSDNPGRVAQLKQLIAKLDVPAKTDGNTRVIYLRNADATKLAEILRGLLEAEARAQPAAARQAAGRGAAPAAQGAKTSLIQADEETNSLIISAPDSVYNNLRGVIEKLDTPRAQVFVEAIIVEIQHTDAMQLGFQWAGAGDIGEGGGAGLINFPESGAGIVATALDPVTTLGSAAGLSLAFLGEEVTLSDGTTVRGLGGLARALEERNIANILSTPNLLTLDNAEAKIVVGQNVPFRTGSFTTTTSGADNPFQTVERKDVGVTLQIKPQITEGNNIKLEISTEASSVARSTLVVEDLITNTRTLETTIVVEDGHSIALGGLIQDTFDDTNQQVPWLGRIPFLGWLFRFKEKTKGKVNLMVFLRPTIVRKPSDAYAFTADRYDYILGEQLYVNPEKDSTDALRPFAPTRPDASPRGAAQPKGVIEESLSGDEDSGLLGPPGIGTDDAQESAGRQGDF